MLGDWTPDDFAGAELVPIGARHCLFRPDNHALGLLNEEAAAVWRTHCTGNTPLDNALPENSTSACCETSIRAEELVAGWRAAGFLGHGTQPDLAASKREPVREQRTFIVGGARPIGVGVEDAELATHLRAVLAPIQSNGPAQTRVDIVSSETMDIAYEIWSDDALLAVCDNRSDARRIALQAILLGLHKPESVAAILHASAVTIDGRCVLLAGATGSGKSTLTAALVAHGARYLGDDLVALGTDGRSAGGFPIAASIKSGSWDRVGRLFPALKLAPKYQLANRHVRYVGLGGTTTPNISFMPVTALVFPEFQEDTAVHAEQMATENAFARLIETGTEIVGTPRSVKPLVALVEDYPSWRIEYGNLDAAIGEVLTIAGRA